MTPPEQAGSVARTIRFPDDLNRRLQQIADDDDRSFSWAVVTACETWTAMWDSKPGPAESELPPMCEVTGPWGGGDHHRLEVEGIPVPYLTVHPGGTDSSNPEPREYHLTLDHRFGITVGAEDLWRWGWFLANAMAVAAGYSSHGPHSRRMNRHGQPEEDPANRFDTSVALPGRRVHATEVEPGQNVWIDGRWRGVDRVHEMVSHYATSPQAVGQGLPAVRFELVLGGDPSNVIRYQHEWLWVQINPGEVESEMDLRQQMTAGIITPDEFAARLAASLVLRGVGSRP